MTAGFFLSILGRSNYFFSWEFSRRLSKVVLLGKDLPKENSKQQYDWEKILVNWEKTFNFGPVRALEKGLDCNATLRCSQLQRVWEVSCSQSQMSDSVRYFLPRSVALQVIAACMTGSCKYKNPCFTSFIFSPMSM